MYRDIREIASILDDDIEKSELINTVEDYERCIEDSLEKGLGTITWKNKKLPSWKEIKRLSKEKDPKTLTNVDREKEIGKSISFNPLIPVEMNTPKGEGFYSPYRRLADGSYAPYSVEHWAEHGKNPADYREVHRFLTEANYYTKKSKEFTNKMRALVGSDLIKARAQIGETHEWNGVKFKKVSDSPSQWQPVSEGHEGMAIQDTPGTGQHQEIETRAGRMTELTAEKKRRSQHEETKESAKKETLSQVASVAEKMGTEFGTKFKEHLVKVQKKEKKSKKKVRVKTIRKHWLGIQDKLKRGKSGEVRKAELTKYKSSPKKGKKSK